MSVRLTADKADTNRLFNKTTTIKAFHLLLLLLIALTVHSQEAEYEEIPVFVRIQGIGGFEINAIYAYETGQLYLPVVDLFSVLRIRYDLTPSLDTISGFLIDEDKRYLFDYPNRRIHFNGTPFELQESDLIKTETGVYLNTVWYGRIFGLHATFYFRSLSVEVKTDLDLPAIREMRLAQMRKNIEQLRGETVVDTTLLRRYHLFRFGVADWSLSSTQHTAYANDTRVSLALGAEALAGETNVILNYSSRDGYNDRNQQYYWRWANNSTRLIRQIRVGKIRPGNIASVYDPVIGMTATNARTTYRRSFGEYTITDHTEPGWTVELYINNVMVDYQTADASGFFTFDVPLVYGTSQVMMKFYGPYGEERIREQFLNVPYNFLPKGELEYKISGGMVQDTLHSRFGRAEFNYGINRHISLGGGMEYLSSVVTGSEIPFVTASVTPFRNLLITGEYARNVRTKALMSYRLPSGLMVELDYSLYEPGQKAIRFNYLEERKATLSVPLRYQFLRGFTRLSFKQNVYEMLTYNTADMTFSTYMGSVSGNISAFGSWIAGSKPFVYSNITGGIRLGKGLTLRPQAQVDISNRSVVTAKMEAEKRISRSGYLSLAYEENFRSAIRSVDFSFRWDLPFAQTNFSARVAGRDFSSSQGLRGSLAFGSGNGYVHLDNRSAMSRGGLTIAPFIDINHNGIRDEGEPFATGVNVRINGGRILRNINDSLIRVIELEPYTRYVIEMDDASLEQIAWRLKHKAISICIDPNQFKKIDLPVLPMGEANGMVYIIDEKGTRGLGRVVVNFFRHDNTFVAKTMTESDGSFTFLGLPPGNFYAQVDTVQMSRLNMESDPVQMEFDILPISYGDIVDGLEFALTRKSGAVNDTGAEEVPVPEATTPETTINDATLPEKVDMKLSEAHETSETKATPAVSSSEKAATQTETPPSPVVPAEERESPSKDLHSGETVGEVFYFVQLGAFRRESNATLLLQRLKSFYQWPVWIDVEDGLHKVRMGRFADRTEADGCSEVLLNHGLETWIGKHLK